MSPADAESPDTPRRHALLCLLAPRASPLVARHVEVGAQRAPHVAWNGAVLDGLRRGAPEPGQHVVDEQRGTTYRPELTLDEFVEFRQTHVIKLRRRPERFLAHPYRIGDLGNAGARPPRGL